jgi:hypothetical protein
LGENFSFCKFFDDESGLTKTERVRVKASTGGKLWHAFTSFWKTTMGARGLKLRGASMGWETAEFSGTQQSGKRGSRQPFAEIALARSNERRDRRKIIWSRLDKEHGIYRFRTARALQSICGGLY